MYGLLLGTERMKSFLLRAFNFSIEYMFIADILVCAFYANLAYISWQVLKCYKTVLFGGINLFRIFLF